MDRNLLPFVFLKLYDRRICAGVPAGFSAVKKDTHPMVILRQVNYHMIKNHMWLSIFWGGIPPQHNFADKIENPFKEDKIKKTCTVYSYLFSRI